MNDELEDIFSIVEIKEHAIPLQTVCEVLTATQGVRLHSVTVWSNDGMTRASLSWGDLQSADIAGKWLNFQIPVGDSDLLFVHRRVGDGFRRTDIMLRGFLNDELIEILKRCIKLVSLMRQCGSFHYFGAHARSAFENGSP